ncbi:flagellar protein FliT [Caldifermentibacillus hisashii]|uniref:flagellar protein FliT n=1 Tax=Caldifermentibacillus hisashii TaxID=996558 RepID=UPI003366DE18
MDPLKECYELTAEIIRFFEDEQNDDRDSKISVLQDKLRKRDDLMKKITPPFSDGEQVLGRQLLQLNDRLLQLLNKEKATIQQDITKVKKRKKIHTGYINPYGSLQTDGYFYDKKK